MRDTKKKNTITIYGTKIEPGKNKRINIPIDKLPTGTLIEIPVYVFNGKNPGSTVLLQGGLHGDEINGVEILKRMISNHYFENVKSGCIIVVPLLNVFGFIHFSREVTSGKDVNRSFPGSKQGSLAGRIAHHHIQEIVQHIDFGIDFHTGGDRRNNFPQVRYSDEMPESKKLAQLFNAPFWFSSGLIDKSFRKAAFDLDIPIIVYEGGESLRFDEFAIKEGIEGTLNILSHYNIIEHPKIEPSGNQESIHLTKKKWLRATNGGIFVPLVLNGQKVEKDQVIGYVSDAYGNDKENIKVPFNAYVFCINHFPLVNQGDALFHIGI